MHTSSEFMMILAHHWVTEQEVLIASLSSVFSILSLGYLADCQMFLCNDGTNEVRGESKGSVHR